MPAGSTSGAGILEVVDRGDFEVPLAFFFIASFFLGRFAAAFFFFFSNFRSALGPGAMQTDLMAYMFAQIIRPPTSTVRLPLFNS